MIQFNFVSLSMQDGTGSVQSFDRACPRQWLKDLKLFLVLYHNFWPQGCAVAADILYRFEWRLMKLF